MRYAAAAFAALVLALLAPTASAQPPVSDSGHTHHVNTANGDCISIDEVRFLTEDRGLHQGANASGSEHGPWHGPC